MNKAELLQQVKKFETLYDLYNNKYYIYVNSKQYTEEFLKNKSQEIIDIYKKEVQKLANDLLVKIDVVSKPYQDSTVADLKNADYQVGLNNLINAIKAGVVQQDSLPELEKTYRTNKMAIGLLQKACEQNGLVFVHDDPMLPYNKLKEYIQAFGDTSNISLTDNFRKLWIREYIGIVEEHLNKHFDGYMKIVD